MSDEKQEPGQRPTAEDLRDLLPQRRPLNQHDDYYDHPLCPCEKIEPENQSEYDVAGDWVTYDGPINEDIFEHASSNAAQDLEAQLREFYQEPVAPPPPPPSAHAQVTNDAPEAPKPKVKKEWPTIVAEIYAVETNGNKVASQTAEDRAALLNPPAAEREEPRHFASINDYPAKNLVLPEVRQAIFVKRNFQDRGTCYSSSQSSRDGVVTAESADGQAPQANDGGVALADITSAESQALLEASGTDEVLNE